MSRISGVAGNLKKVVEKLAKIQYVKVNLKSETQIEGLSLLPLGMQLLENLKREWINSDPVINIYHKNSSDANEKRDFQKDHVENPLASLKSRAFEEHFRNLSQNYQAEIPLGISECLSYPSMIVRAENPGESLDFSLKSIQYLTCLYFISPVSAIEQFYRIQRQRKIWWMRYSSNPGRFKISESKITEYPEGKVQKISVKSSLKDSSVDLETIELISLNPGANIEIKDPRSGRKITPSIVKTGMCLEIATLGVLIDAVNSSDDSETLLLHRKIAPHQLAVFCFSEAQDNLADLQDLARLLTIKTRKAGIATLNLPKCSTAKENLLSRQICEMDQLGVPYCFILEDESLRSGLIKLRSRDTTLSETVHLTDIPRYLLKIYSSF
ncbi:DNA polymerase subunit gamma-2, mitochondrial [Phlebotomus argentipes]|uniref:DNA polymerase subunit gamma-2, mitochondrial n=1 Tax=Phlebotomus argentipes TaxID=94469 RepID=UPI0028930F97|nr:DNA polymerase subunit gamma-2, mitochondrial [Phlebotomus argentipes]